MIDELVERDATVVGAQRPGESGAGGGQRLESGMGEHACRPDVERIRHHEHTRLGVQLEESGTTLLWSHPVVLLGDGVAIVGCPPMIAHPNVSVERESSAAWRAASAKSSPLLA